MLRGVTAMEEEYDEIFEHLTGLAEELKTIHSIRKEPLNEDEIQVQYFCINLEKILRYGLRDKLIFFRAKRGYWNYISECIPTDETVVYIQSEHELKTNQGRGRAFLRQALVDKSLGDALKKCWENEKLSREYYVKDSLFRDDHRLQSLLEVLGDLRSTEFSLPNKGYNLDRDWPSRQNSSLTSSLASFTQSTSEPDPFVLLNTVIKRLRRTLDTWKGIKSKPKKEDGSPPKLQDMIDQMLSINKDIIKMQTKTGNEIVELSHNMTKIKEEKENLVKTSEENIKEIYDKYFKLLVADEADDHVRDIFDQLRTTEINLVRMQNAKTALENELETLKFSLLNLENEKSVLKLKNENLDELVHAIMQSKETGDHSEGLDRADALFNQEEFESATRDKREEILKNASAMFGCENISAKIFWNMYCFLEKKLVEVQNELSLSEEEKKKYKEEIAALKNEVASLQKKVEWEEIKNSQEVELEKSRLEKKELEGRCQELESEILEMNVTINTLTENVEELKSHKVSNEELIVKLKSEIDGHPLKEKYEILKEENDNLKVQLTSSLVQAQTFQQEVENIKHEMESGTQTIKFKINSTEFKTESGQHICVLCIGIALAGFIKRQTYGRMWKVLFG